MFSDLFPGAKEKTVYLNRSATPKGGEKVKFHPSLRSWGPIFDSNSQVLPPPTANTW